ncbi:MAG: hypothetical protein PUP92_19285 [Rhizonema sp. PD38]|nr:hypothetical protein [Rhizonema sp. PD38]
MNEEVESTICTKPGKNPLDCQIRGETPGSCISCNNLVSIPEQVDNAVLKPLQLGFHSHSLPITLLKFYR